MSEEFVNICIIILIIIGCAYFYFNTMKMTADQREGFDTASKTAASTTDTKTVNERDGAKKYVETLNGANTNLKNGLNIPQYRVDYENVLVKLDDYIGYSMLKTALDVNINLSDPISAISSLDNLNKLNDCKRTLNDLMKWMDKQN